MDASLCKKSPYSELFWSAFSRISTQYRKILRISPYSAKMRENADKNNSEYGHFYAVLMAGIISDEKYDHLEENRLLPEEQKESRRKCQATKYQLVTDRCILKNCRKRNSSMIWMDYKKTYGMEKYTNQFPLGEEYFKVTRSNHYCL